MRFERRVRLEDLRTGDFLKNRFGWTQDGRIPIACALLISVTQLFQLSLRTGWGWSNLFNTVGLMWLAGVMLGNGLGKRRYWRLATDLRSDLARRDGERARP